MRQLFSSPSISRSLRPLWLFLVAIAIGCGTPSAIAAVAYRSISSATNDALPTNGSAGNLTINKPASTANGDVMLATISARPSGMTITAPSGWTLYKRTEQTNGGVATAPGGMSLLTYFKLAGGAEPASYTWTLANPQNEGGGVVGTIISVSGADTVNPIDVYTDSLTNSGTTHTAPSVTTTVANTLLVSSITYLSSRNFSAPTGTGTWTQRAEVRAPTTDNAIGISLLVATSSKTTAGASGTVSATADGDADYGMGHTFAIAAPRPDLSLAMTRTGNLDPGTTTSYYTLTITNIGTVTEGGTITVSNTLPANVSYTSNTGSTGAWSCSTAGQVVTCTTNDDMAANDVLTLRLNVSVGASASGTLTNTATVTGAANNDSNTSNNTASNSYSIAAATCTTTTVGSDTVVTCTASGSINIPSNVSSVRYLIVGGGGGGGGISSGDMDGAGGGGAGGVLSGTSLAVTPGNTYSVTVGSGGAAGTGSTRGGTGGSSTFATLTASGGGGGAWAGDNTGTSGASGASGGGGSDDNNGGTGTAGQGNDGGDGNNNDGGGGGGGAGAVGANGTSTTGGNGGIGVSDDISGTATYYGGGGGGGADSGGAGGSGGTGGGGSAPTGRGAGTAGSANTGGGGGGATGSGSGSAYDGGAGGSGIVIIRYPTTGTPGASCNTGTISGVVNTYYPVTASLSAGATTITVGTPTGSSTTLLKDDLVLIVQMQDTGLDTTNGSSYGTASSINAGKYEYAVVSSVVGSTVTLTSGLTNSYTQQAGSNSVAQKTIQLIRVPVYSSATLGSGTTASAWNGSTGGVLAFDVTGALALNGATIDVSGKGFRGGGGRQLSGGSGSNTDYRTMATNNANGSKGEGIAGTPRYLNNAGSLQDTGVEGYPNGSYARGAPANAGGGGTDDNPPSNDENTGGGGGANAGGGGYGGYAWNAATSPGRGIGGAAVTSSASRLILGGGGGSGTSNNGTGSPGSGLASSGAAGGGLVMIRAGSLTGTGTINANGENANNTVLNDGSGGGGAGGTVMVYTGSGLTGLSVTAAGGTGGTNTGGGSDHGPGGGGGGGYVLSSSTLSSCSVDGGAGGTTYASHTYGATAGSAGTCATTLAAAQIVGKALGSGPCSSSVVSFLVDAPGSASTCGTAGGTPAAPIITVTAKDGGSGSGNTVTSYAGTITLSTSTGRGTWAKVSGQADGTLTGSSYTFLASDSGDAQFYLVSGVGEDLTVSATDSSASGTSGTVQFRDNAFVVTPTDALGTTVVAGRDQAMKIEFWKKDPTSGLCGIETSYTGSHNLDAWYTADTSHPAAANAPSIGSLTLPAADPGGAATNNLALTFTDGVATFNLTTSDVGKYDLNFQDDSRTFSGTLDIAGSSNTLTVRPFALHVAVTGNPAVSSASGTVFTSAGTSFPTTVRGVLWQAADDANNDGTPDQTGSTLNAALADNTTAPHFAWATTLTADTTAGTYTPAGGTLGALTNGSLALTDYSSGAATAASLQYAEVGSFTLLANATGYLGTTGVDLAANAGVVGRFRPHYFLMTGTLTNRQGASCSPASSFTYMDEPFRVTLNLTAKNANGGTTQNYDTALGFARLDAATASWLTHGSNSTIGTGAIDGTTNLTSRLSVSGTPSGSWSSGTASLLADIVLSRPTTTTPDATWGPYATLKVGAMPQDADGTTLLAAALDLDVDTSGANERQRAGTTASYFGRLRVSNAFGSENLALVMPVQLEYYSSGRWQTNSADSCTLLSSLAGPTTVLTIGTGSSTPRCNVAANTCTATSGVACNAASAISGGSAGLCLTAPGAVGSADVTFAPPAYLQHSSGSLTGRAGFGLYNQSGNSQRIIYRREVR